jgi:hypothetical protein
MVYSKRLIIKSLQGCSTFEFCDSQVVGDTAKSEAWLLRERLMKEEPTDEDRKVLLEKLFSKDRPRNEPCHVCP